MSKLFIFFIFVMLLIPSSIAFFEDSTLIPILMPIYHSGNSFSSSGYWALSGTNIYNNNTGNVGIGITAPVSKLQVQNGTVMFNGTTGTTPESGAGTRFMWIPAKKALRAGAVTTNYWDDVNIGVGSVAFGENNFAKGIDSFATGVNNLVYGDYSVSLGQNTIESQSSVALGISNYIQKTLGSEGGQVAIGNGNSVNKVSTVGIGYNNQISGSYSVGIGANNVIATDNSYAFGYNNVANGEGAVAIGYGSDSAGLATISIGSYSQAQWDNAIAIGISAMSYGDGSLVLGYGSSAYSAKDYAIGTGLNVMTTAFGSFIIGVGPVVNAPFLTQDNTFVLYGEPQVKENLAFTAGVGTFLTPASTWSIYGNSGIGEDYSTRSPPANGLIVEGDVGIGTHGPAYKLDVSGYVNSYGYYTNTTKGISKSVTVRNSAGTGTCTLIYTGGLYTGGTC